MNITLSIGPLVSLLAGILILIVPRMLNYIVAIYLIVIGLLGVFGAGNFRLEVTGRLRPRARVVPAGLAKETCAVKA